MPDFKKYWLNLKAHYLDLSLRSKISLVLILTVSVVCGLVMLASYASTYYLILNHTQDLVNSEAKLNVRELQIKLLDEIQSASEASTNPITANALTDTEESDLYLLPFLKNQQHAFAGTVMTIVDYRGRQIASNSKNKLDYQSHPTLQRMMELGRKQISIVADEKKIPQHCY